MTLCAYYRLLHRFGHRSLSHDVCDIVSTKHSRSASLQHCYLTINLQCNLHIPPPASFCHPNMDADIILPPAAVRGMTKLDRAAFCKNILVPHVTVKTSKVDSVLMYLKKYLLKLSKITPVSTADDNPDHTVILLNPTLLSDLQEVKDELQVLCGEDVTCEHKHITLGYDNFKADDLLKAILPDGHKGGHGYSIIGHIVHLNLREHLLPYKSIIGQVLLDKIPYITLVVNKLNIIDSTYRNFQMEVLAGEGDTEVTVKENGCSYTLDFAQVYWNPRLSTEHNRVVRQLHHGDVLYDVMAGVGPFAIPAARKKCHVLANDLNPDSFEALQKNIVKNKVAERVKCFKLDGHEFISTVLKSDLLERWRDQYFTGNIHVTMNLPALAVTFLATFRGLLEGLEGSWHMVHLPVVHVYMFTKDTDKDSAIGHVAENLGYSSKTGEKEGFDALQNNDYTSVRCANDGCKYECVRSYESLVEHVQEVIHVRQVAPNKAMMRVSFELPLEVLLEDHIEPPPCKRIKP